MSEEKKEKTVTLGFSKESEVLSEKVRAALQKIGAGAIKASAFLPRLSAAVQKTRTAYVEITLDAKPPKPETGFPLKPEAIQALKDLKVRLITRGRAVPRAEVHDLRTVSISDPIRFSFAPRVPLAELRFYENLHLEYVRRFRDQTEPETVAELVGVTGFGERRVRKLIRKQKNKRARLGLKPESFAVVAACVFMAYLTKRAKEKVGTVVESLQDDITRMLLNETIGGSRKEETK